MKDTFEVIGDFGFDSWMRAVDFEVERLTGLSVHDLADNLYRDWCDSGMTPEEAAKQALENEGLPVGEGNA